MNLPGDQVILDSSSVLLVEILVRYFFTFCNKFDLFCFLRCGKSLCFPHMGFPVTSNVSLGVSRKRK